MPIHRPLTASLRIGRRRMKVTRAQILAFLNDGAEESTKLRAGDVAFLVKRGNTIRPAPKHKPLALPCLIELPSSYGKDQRERLRWVCYDERGKLRLSDEKSDSLPLREPDAQDPDRGKRKNSRRNMVNFSAWARANGNNPARRGVMTKLSAIKRTCGSRGLTRQN